MKVLIAMTLSLLSLNALSMIEGRGTSTIDNMCGHNEACWGYATTTSLPTMIIDSAETSIDTVEAQASLLAEAYGEFENTPIADTIAQRNGVQTNEVIQAVFALEIQERELSEANIIDVISNPEI